MAYGIIESTPDNAHMVWLFNTKEEREVVWKSRTKVGREKLGWAKCVVDIDYEE